jgi:multicomponent Na+:H+ antiporter subunit A
MESFELLVALLGLHAVTAVLAAAAGRALGRRAFWVTGIAPAATVVWAATQARAILSGRAVESSYAWVPSIGLDIGFRLDAFGLLMVGLVSGIGTLIFVYAFFYFSHPRPDLGRFAGTLVAFAGSMLGLVTADNILLLFVFWELTSITSYLLIGFEHVRETARGAALQALLITGGGGLAMLGGFILLAQAAGTYSLAGILAGPPEGGTVAAAAILILAGAATKSAQVPFHPWLPGAMTAPTPVSAYLHSATMVKAGVYLVARVAPALAVATAVWRPAAVTLGVVTMVVGGYRALRQHDLKLLLAYGTVSQLGLMFAVFATGTEQAAFAGAALLLAHGIFKAALFMLVGVIDHEAGTRDIRALSGLGRRLPAVTAAACVAAASMAGLPPLAGFVAKEAALEALSSAPATTLASLWLAGVVLGSVFTVAYSFRFCWGAFATKPALEPTAVPHRPPFGFWAPAGLLAVLAVLLGLAPWLETGLVEAATVALHPDAHPHPLALWHGLGVPLALTAVVLAAGAALVAARGRVEALQGRAPRVPQAAGAYARGLTGFVRLAGRVTAVVQAGSLPVYLGIILMVVVALPATRLLQGTSAWLPARVADSPLQIVAVAVAITAAFGVVVAERRFAAVLALGGVGYATVTLFALHGAPDLALTQLLIETLTLVVFVLALRHLPSRFTLRRWRLSQSLRWVISVAVGVFVAGFGLIAGAARRAPSVSEEFVARSAAEAGGHNVVNVILVDFRGLDTLGEITVLAVAALGIAALVLAPRWNAAEVSEIATAGDPEEEGVAP